MDQAPGSLSDMLEDLPFWSPSINWVREPKPWQVQHMQEQGVEEGTSALVYLAVPGETPLPVQACPESIWPRCFCFPGGSWQQ